MSASASGTPPTPPRAVAAPQVAPPQVVPSPPSSPAAKAARHEAAETAAAWPFLPPFAGVGRATAQPFMDLSALMVRETERLVEQQLQLCRSSYDGWLRQMRAMNDSALHQWASAAQHLASALHGPR
ncbi:hypothetical protein [Siccirubricoccus phaeus]|uniref:hypothetical protein n=1 Tax=Siccirubricoccus phaeus TaxID=2595053 RepID=UPI0011F0F386|nr:hypothetical protein [Siccirubricoccus phaeus]